MKKLIGLCLLLLSGFVIYLAHPMYLPYWGEFLIVSDPLQRADAIVVLGGDDASGNRVSEAVSLLRKGWSDRLFLSGGPIARDVFYPEVMRKQAEKLGVPTSQIVLLPTNEVSGGLATSTLSEAQLLLPQCRSREYHSIIVVTSNYHTRRAKRIFGRVFKDSGILVIVHPSPDDSFKVNHWWTRRADFRTWLLEMEKLAFSYWEVH